MKDFLLFQANLQTCALTLDAKIVSEFSPSGKFSSPATFFDVMSKVCSPKRGTAVPYFSEYFPFSSSSSQLVYSFTRRCKPYRWEKCLGKCFDSSGTLLSRYKLQASNGPILLTDVKNCKTASGFGKNRGFYRRAVRFNLSPVACFVDVLIFSSLLIVTHIVTTTNGKGVCPRTIKYLNGVLTGKWIVNYDCKYGKRL